MEQERQPVVGRSYLKAQVHDVSRPPHVVGVGARGSVTLVHVRHGEDTTLLAALKKPLKNDDEARGEFHTECAAFRDMMTTAQQHPHVLRCIGFVYSTDRERTRKKGRPMGVLTDVLDTCMWNALANGRETADRWFPNLADALETLSGVPRGLMHIHAHGYVHSDLRAPNVFLKKEVDATVTAVVGDIGSVEPVGDHIHPEYANNRKEFAHLAGKDTVMTPAVDVFSFAVLVAEAVIFREPVNSVEELSHVRRENGEDDDSAIDADLLYAFAVERTTADEMPRGLLRDLCFLLETCTRLDPRERPDMEEVLRRVLECAAVAKKKLTSAGCRRE